VSDAAGLLDTVADIDAFAAFGIRAFTTTRATGTFRLDGDDPAGAVVGRWHALQGALAALGAPRLASARQVHGARVVRHGADWAGWLRVDGADGHVATGGGIALAVSVADCVPVLLAHPSGMIAALHAGWRGAAAGILDVALAAFRAEGLVPADLRMHLGPAICGPCYEVGADVYAQVTGGPPPPGPVRLDVRNALEAQAARAGIRELSRSEDCVRCRGDRYFSHRAGDGGRQLAVIVAPGS
jgi:YfiH family protein